MFMTIDPGIGGTGVAYWEEEDWKELCCPAATEILKPRSGATPWQERSQMLVSELVSGCKGWNVTKIWCEWVLPHGGAGGHAALQRGDIFKLAYFIGSLASQFYPRPFLLVTSNQWKGQMPKATVKHRITELLPLEGLTDVMVSAFTETRMDHDWDAVGLGLWAKGYL